MTDIFAILDAAVTEIGQRSRFEFPLFPSAAASQTGTGTPICLGNNGVPVLPVVPAENRIIQDGIEHIRENTPAEGNGNGDSAPTKYILEDTGTTGSTGSPEDICRADNSRELSEHGNNGNGNPAARSAVTVELEFPEIAYLAEHGLVIDFETRSAASLKEVGPFVYADRAWTQVWVACYAIGEGPVRVWRPGESVPADMAAHVRAGLPLIAHNASFERAIWAKIMTPRHGWPEPQLEQWHCTASMAAAMALPRKLEEAAKLLGCTFQKDMSGHRLMLQMAKPRSVEDVPCLLCGAVGEEAGAANCPCQHDPGYRMMVKWLEDPENIRRGTEYCIRDVETERELLTKLRPLPEFERSVWLLDQRINERGVRVDVPIVRNAQKIVNDRVTELNAELNDITGGTVSTATQIVKLVLWLRSKGVVLPGTPESGELGKEEVEALLKGELLEECRRALEIRLEGAKTSTAKLDAYVERTSSDGRMRDNLKYHGAGRTGRWSGQGAQLQNLPRPPAIMKPADIECALKVIEMGWSIGGIGMLMPVQGLEIIAASLRPMLIAAPGHDLIAADYNAIDARGTAWLAAAIGMLGVFQRNEDPYLYMACQIYNKEQGSLTKKDHPTERQLGKTAVLGLGYQMGAERFKKTCGKDGVLITDEQAERVKRIYRESNPEIVRLWRELQEAAIRAVQNPGTLMNAANGRLGFVTDGCRLHLRLPSGRLLTYANPRYELAETRFGQSWTVTFEGVNSITHKWERQQAYGGKWCENAVQAICRDLLANAMLNLEAAGYPIVLSVHDEAVAEVPGEFGTVQEFEQIMCRLPDWANGFPVKAEGWRAKRFQK
jgi:DNA polymerase